jgi:hypothetical protein
MINLYIFLAVLVGILILISIKFYIVTPSTNNKNNYSIQQKTNLNHYGKYGSLGKYSDYNI